MRRTLLKLLRISEFSDEAQFRNPSLLFTVQDVICLCCNFCRSIDLCHDPQLFKCSASRSDDDDRGEEYEKDADAFSAWHCPRATRCTTRPHSELRLVEMIQAQSVAYQLQDCTAVSAICQLSAKCAITAHVQRRIHLYLTKRNGAKVDPVDDKTALNFKTIDIKDEEATAEEVEESDAEKKRGRLRKPREKEDCLAVLQASSRILCIDRRPWPNKVFL
ncbi:unnamed protein product [Peronospora belbahrii]|uniref:DNA polymerase epsilon catalytic subunit n=1 Tax=Peronospora belbahrii TaxID=622444 RepID=A0ABN8CNP6_9STRA|nr:unnamed protein product [Peronospora belbahrii]